MKLDRPDILGWLKTEDPAPLFLMADAVRRKFVGNAVHLRGLIEISNHCVRSCAYCGLRAENTLRRYRLSTEEFFSCVRRIDSLGFGTVVIQAGEDYGITTEWMVSIIKRIKAETPLAVTLSLGERPYEDLAAWREAGADRYLLRFETSDAVLYRKIHPSLPSRTSDRLEILRRLKSLGYEVGSGVMVGIPGQDYRSLAEDILTFRSLDLDMIGVGPFLPHPDTPLGRGELHSSIPEDQQVPNSEIMVLKVIALSRLACPWANIPSTTALATLNPQNGYELGLTRGANVVMPNFTPGRYRSLYAIYPNKICLSEPDTGGSALNRIRSIGRTVGKGTGGRRTPDGTLSECGERR